MSAEVIQGRSAAEPGLVAVVASAARVWATSPLRWFVVAAAAWSLISVAILVRSGGTSWERFLAFQNLWVVAVGPAFTAVLAGWLARAEASCRRGATTSRGIAPWRRRIAQLVVVWGWATLAQGAVVAVAVAMYAAAGSGSVPLVQAGADALRLVAALAVASLGFTAMLVVVGEVAGLLGCSLIALVFIIAAAATAESTWWWASPPAWQLRPVLDLITTHANGTALQGQTIDGAPLALALCVLLAVAALTLAPVATLATRNRRRPGAPAPVAPTRRQGPDQRLRGGSMISVVMAVRGSGAVVLAAAAVGLAVALLRWRQPGEVATIWALVAMPLGSAIIPVLWIPRLRAGLGAVAMRQPRPIDWGWRLMGAMLALLSASSITIAAALGAAGMPAATAALFAAVLCLMGALLVSVSAWLMATVGTFGCLLTTTCGSVVGLLVATNENMSAPLGYLIPWAWAAYLDAAHLSITAPIALGTTALSATLAARAITAHPARRA